MKVYIETYGCTANRADSAGLREAVLAAGGTVVEDPAEADTVVVNTCAVTDHTARSMVRAVRRHAGKRVIVAGCLAAAQPGLLPGYELAAAPGPETVADLLRIPQTGGIPLAMAGRTAIVKIAEGCRGRCSYCIVRRARGELRSRRPEEIIEAVRRAVAAGAAEIFLTAQDTGAYGSDNGYSLPGLIQAVAAVPGAFRVRTGMMNPFSIRGFVPELAAALCLPKVYRFAHVPIQSGSDRILELMNRPYTGEEYARIVAGLRERVHGLVLSSDYIVGFPTETAEDFQLTLEELRRDRPLKVNITRFSARPGTAAAQLPDVLERVKKQRSRSLTALHHEITAEHMKSAVGSRCRALVTENGRPGSVVARDDSYRMVAVGESLPLGHEFDVEICDARTTYLIGRRVAD